MTIKKTLAEELGISETTAPYPTDTSYRYVYVNCLVSVVDRFTKKTLIEPESFETMVFAEPSELDDGKMLDLVATYKAKYRYLAKEKIADRLKEMNLVSDDWYIDLVIMWQYSIPINQFKNLQNTHAAELY